MKNYIKILTVGMILSAIAISLDIMEDNKITYTENTIANYSYTEDNKNYNCEIVVLDGEEYSIEFNCK